MPLDPRWEMIEELFDGALQRSPHERRAWLAQACAEEAMRSEVEGMLTAHERSAGLLEQGPLDVLTTTLEFPESLPRDEQIDGREVGPYRLLRRIGRGGMGVVYQAHDPRLDRHVALKFLPRHLRSRRDRGSGASPIERRFLSEARAASALDHPNIFTVFDMGETECGQLYIAMAYYGGDTLAERISAGPLPVGDAIDFTLQAARGLACAHAAGIVHRDIKPSNLILSERGELKILDFGIAKLEGSTITETGTIPGTLAYMSPEQAAVRRVDHRSDLWSLGAVLYEMLTGRRAFDVQLPSELIRTILHRQPPPLATLRPGLPRRLEQVVSKALAKNPDQRYTSASELIAELAAARCLDAAAPPPSGGPPKSEPIADTTLPARFRPGRVRSPCRIRDRQASAGCQSSILLPSGSTNQPYLRPPVGP